MMIVIVIAIVVPVPREWLLEKLKGQLNRTQEAWARIQPRKNETPAEATARANQYREYRADYTCVLAAKTRVGVSVVMFSFPF